MTSEELAAAQAEMRERMARQALAEQEAVNKELAIKTRMPNTVSDHIQTPTNDLEITPHCVITREDVFRAGGHYRGVLFLQSDFSVGFGGSTYSGRFTTKWTVDNNWRLDRRDNFYADLQIFRPGAKRVIPWERRKIKPILLELIEEWVDSARGKSLIEKAIQEARTKSELEAAVQPN